MAEHPTFSDPWVEENVNLNVMFDIGQWVEDSAMFDDSFKQQPSENTNRERLRGIDLLHNQGRNVLLIISMKIFALRNFQPF